MNCRFAEICALFMNMHLKQKQLYDELKKIICQSHELHLPSRQVDCHYDSVTGGYDVVTGAYDELTCGYGSMTGLSGGMTLPSRQVTCRYDEMTLPSRQVN